LYQNCYKILQKQLASTRDFYEKCCEVQRVFEHCANAIHHVQELFFF